MYSYSPLRKYNRNKKSDRLSEFIVYIQRIAFIVWDFILRTKVFVNESIEAKKSKNKEIKKEEKGENTVREPYNLLDILYRYKTVAIFDRHCPVKD